MLSALARGLGACGGDKKDKDDPEDDAGIIVPEPDAGSDAGIEQDAGEDDAGIEQDAGESDASVDPPKEFTGCDLMEFAPEHRSNQVRESALLNLLAPSLGYFKEMVWFEGGESQGIWMLDAVRLSTSGDPIPFQTGRIELSGNNLGASDDCTICLDLGRSDMDSQTDWDFYPERVRIDVEAADLRAGGALKFKVSGIFREDADPAKRSWCINGLEVDAVIGQFCSRKEDCPEAKPVCAYPPTGNYPICMTEEEADGGE